MSDSLYDGWDWEDTGTSKTDLHDPTPSGHYQSASSNYDAYGNYGDYEERYVPDHEVPDAADELPDDEEFAWSNRLKSNSQKPGFLQIWEDATRTTPIEVNNVNNVNSSNNASTPIVAKRSNGYRQNPGAQGTHSAIGSVARVPNMANLANPYSNMGNTGSNGSKPQVPNLPNLTTASQLLHNQPQSPQYPQSQSQQVYEQPIQYEVKPDFSRVVKPHKDGTYNIPVEPRSAPPSSRVPDYSHRRHKMNRQFFLIMNSIRLSNTSSPTALQKIVDQIVQNVIPESSNENEACLHNADEMVRQMLVQIVGTRNEPERVILLEGVKKIFDMYLPIEVAQKEFIRANNSTYPHPAYVGLQASLDALNYIGIWSGNMKEEGRYKGPIPKLIGQYIGKYKARLSPLPLDVGKRANKTVFYYDV